MPYQPSYPDRTPEEAEAERAVNREGVARAVERDKAPPCQFCGELGQPARGLPAGCWNCPRCKRLWRDAQEMSEPCKARGCTASVPPDRLMCPRHWKMVPRDLQTRVWATYRPGQSAGSATPEWFIAADAAIAAVAQRERKGQKTLPGIG